MRRAILGVALAMMLPVQSLAMTVLCIESRGTGFNWRDGDWEPATYKGRQHLIKEVSDDPVLGEFCDRTEPVVGEYGTTSDLCFNIAKVGEEPDNLYTAVCDVRHGDDGAIISASCSGAFVDFRFFPNGEFLLTRIYSTPEAEPDPAAERDSIAMFVGKCSVIAP